MERNFKILNDLRVIVGRNSFGEDFTANSDKLAMINAFIAEYDGSLSGIQDDLNNTINKLQIDKEGEIELKVVTELPRLDNSIVEEFKKGWDLFTSHVVEYDANTNNEDRELSSLTNKLDSFTLNDITKIPTNSLEEFLKEYGKLLEDIKGLKNLISVRIVDLKNYLSRIKENLENNPSAFYKAYDLCEIFLIGMQVVRKAYAYFLIFKDSLLTCLDD